MCSYNIVKINTCIALEIRNRYQMCDTDFKYRKWSKTVKVDEQLLLILCFFLFGALHVSLIDY